MQTSEGWKLKLEYFIIQLDGSDGNVNTGGNKEAGKCCSEGLPPPGK